MNKKNLIVIIPAKEKNQYSKYGDLHPWGGTTLLEWKISQAKKINFNKNIFVATSSKQIIEKCKNLNIQIFERKKNQTLESLYDSICQNFNNRTIVWLNTTSPFLSDVNINRIINFFLKNKKNYDCLFSVRKFTEFFLLNKELINTKKNKNLFKRDRNHLYNLEMILAAIYIFRTSKKKENTYSFGGKPIFYELDWLSSLEIKNIKDLKIYKDLIVGYLEQNS